MLIKQSIKRFEGYKVDPPKTTIYRIERALSQLGINLSYEIKYLSEHVAIARCNAMSTNALRPIHSTWGKGTTLDLALASATAELAERFSSRFPMKSLTWKVQQKADVAMEDKYTATMIKEYRVIFRDELRAFGQIWKTNKVVGRAPKPLWRKCTSLINPDMPLIYPEGYLSYCIRGTGLAAGNSLEEALVHGICEVVERFSFRHFILFGRKQLHSSAANYPVLLSVSSIKRADDRLRGILEDLDRQGVTVTFLDYSIWGIPTYIAFFERCIGRTFQSRYQIASRYLKQKVVVGVATHPVEALTRCLTEYFIGLNSIDAYLNRDNLFHNSKVSASLSSPSPSFSQWTAADILPICPQWQLHEVLRELRTNAPGVDVSSTDPFARPDLCNLDLAKEIRNLTMQLEKHGIEVFYDDLTRKAIDFPAVFVFTRPIGKKNIKQSYVFSPNYFLGNPRSPKTIDRLYHPLFGIFRHYGNMPIWRSFELLSKSPTPKFLRGFRRTLCGLIYYGHVNLQEFESPFGTDAYRLLIKVDIRLGDYQSALDVINSILSLSPTNRFALAAKGFIYKKLNRRKEARDVRAIMQAIHGRAACGYDGRIDSFSEAREYTRCHPEHCDIANKPKICKTCFYSHYFGVQ